MKTKPTPVPAWASPEASAFFEKFEDRDARIRATAWLRGQHILQNAAATQSEVAETVLTLGGLDVLADSRWSVKQFDSSLLKEAAVAAWLPDSQYWIALDAEIRPVFETWFAGHSKAKAAELAAAEERAAAHTAVREAQAAFQSAIEAGADSELLKARQALLAARKKLERVEA
jgi:hypothetical protein